MKIKVISLFLLTFLFATILQAQTPAFPGAEGGGMYTKGGRGGKVLYVTSLADDGSEGTLRWAVEQKGTRIILFKVSGIIELKSRLNIKNGNLTIAGQSAPGDGICIKDYEVFLDADNVIIRYMRFRLGDEITDHEPDAFWGRKHKNIMIDHCSISWSIDECASFYWNENFTMQWCFVTESLNQSQHDKGTHGYGAIWGGKNATFHHNLLAHHESRNPRFDGWQRSGMKYGNPLDEERVDYRNNVIYNWRSKSAYGGESAGKYNMINNYYKSGPATTTPKRLLQISMDSDPDNYPPGYGQFYMEGNYLYGEESITADNWKGVKFDDGVDSEGAKAATPFDCYPVTTHTPEKALELVLAYGGASLNRDEVDARIASEVEEGSFTYTGSKSGYKGVIDSQQDVGGWPVYNSLEAPVDTNGDGIPDGWLESNYPGKEANDVNEEGYTYLEVYLNSLVEGHFTTVIKKEKIAKESALQVNYDSSTKSILVRALEQLRKVYVYDGNGQMLVNNSCNSSETKLKLKNNTSSFYIVKAELANGEVLSSKVLLN